MWDPTDVPRDLGGQGALELTAPYSFQNE